MPSESLTFTYRNAQSRTIAIAVSGILLVETAVLHLWISSHSPMIAWTMSAGSVATLLWLWRDDSRYRRGTITVSADAVEFDLGTRWRARVNRSLIESVVRPSWQDLPGSSTTAAADYVNVTKPADANVLLTLSEHAPMRVYGMVTKNVRRIGIHLDAPDDFVRSLR